MVCFLSDDIYTMVLETIENTDASKVIPLKKQQRYARFLYLERAWLLVFLPHLPVRTRHSPDPSFRCRSQAGCVSYLTVFAHKTQTGFNLTHVS